MFFIKVVFILGNDPNFVCMNIQKKKLLLCIYFAKKYITDKFHLLNNHFKKYDGSKKASMNGSYI